MTKYEELEQKRLVCLERSKANFDRNLSEFYRKAAIGYKIKQIKLLIREVKEDV